jgi:hypothetical protein
VGKPSGANRPTQGAGRPGEPSRGGRAR